MVDPKETTVAQTHEPPMTGLDAVKDHATAVRPLVSWDRVGVLMDEGPQAIVTVLLDGDAVVSASRFCLTAAESVDALRAYDEGSAAPMELRCWQDRVMTSEQTRNLAELTTIWRESSGQRKEQAGAGWLTFFGDIERDTRKKGRGGGITGPTRNQVLLDAHGRCMFEGCGADLTEDPVTRVPGNFATLAHNVAASEGGTRGVLYLSGGLADDPENILLLCDTHHRLVDTVARADYPAATLSAMRRRFCEAATALLDALALAPTPAFCVAWPVHRQRIALPSSQQVARALKPIGARLDGQLRTVNDNEAVLRSLEGEDLWHAMGKVVEQTAADILLQAHGEGYRAALFAMGLMPPLIALGAKLGNKCEITPMLRYRENGLWYWPVNEPRASSTRSTALIGYRIGGRGVPAAGPDGRPEGDAFDDPVPWDARRVGGCPHGVPGQRRPRPSRRWCLVQAADAGAAAPVGGRARCSASACATVRVQRGVRVLWTVVRQLPPGVGDLRFRAGGRLDGAETAYREREQRIHGQAGRGCEQVSPHSVRRTVGDRRAAWLRRNPARRCLTVRGRVGGWRGR